MNIPYIQLLPTVFVRADAFPAALAAQTMVNTLPGFSATEWDDEPTKPDRVLPAGLREQLQAAGPKTRRDEDLPSHIERVLADRYEVEPGEMRRLKGWMRERSLRVSHFSKAVDFLSQMRLAAYEESFDNEPTVKIDISQVQKTDPRKKENRHGIVRLAPL